MIARLGLQELAVSLPVATAVFHTHPLTAEALIWTLYPGGIAVTLESLRKGIAPQLFGVNGSCRSRQHEFNIFL